MVFTAIEPKLRQQGSRVHTRLTSVGDGLNRLVTE